MNYGKAVMAAVEAHISSMEGIDAQEREVEKELKEERITGRVAMERRKVLEDKRAALHLEAIEKINDLHRQHDEAVDKWNALDGSKLHADAEILKMDLPMNQTQYQQLVDKHRDNSLMLSLLAAYADRHPDEPLFADRPADEKIRKAEFADYCERAAGVCTNWNSLAAAMFLDGKSIPPSVGYDY